MNICLCIHECFCPRHYLFNLKIRFKASSMKQLNLLKVLGEDNELFNVYLNRIVFVLFNLCVFLNFINFWMMLCKVWSESLISSCLFLLCSVLLFKYTINTWPHNQNKFTKSWPDVTLPKQKHYHKSTIRITDNTKKSQTSYVILLRSGIRDTKQANYITMWKPSKEF